MLFKFANASGTFSVLSNNAIVSILSVTVRILYRIDLHSLPNPSIYLFSHAFTHSFVYSSIHFYIVSLHMMSVQMCNGSGLTPNSYRICKILIVLNAIVCGGAQIYK